jgi:acid phosphatase (class A)
MLMLTVSARPWTCCLIAIGQAVGQLVAMHFKYKYMRARPVQVYPAIMPPVTTPAHPSYPNSHALQGHLMSLFVTAACPALRDPLMALADRVGQNRIIAGLHFPSDTDASVRMAEQLLPLISAGAEFQKVLAGAATELQGLTTFSAGGSAASA